MDIEPLIERDLPIVKAMELKVFHEHQVDWDNVLTEEGKKRYDVRVIRDRDRDYLAVAVAVLDNRLGDDRYEDGWAALDTLMRDPDPRYAGLGKALLKAVMTRVANRQWVGSKPVQAIYTRVHGANERLARFYLEEGFYRPDEAEEEQVEGAHREEVVLHWRVPGKKLEDIGKPRLCVLM